SVDGSTPETYLNARGIPAFERVVDNVGQMVRLERELGTASPRLSFWVTGLRDNLAELPDVIDLAARVGVREVYLQRMVFGFGNEDVLARQDQSIYDGYRAVAERVIADAERRADGSRGTLRGAVAVRQHECVVDG